jgi:uncharacterized protein YqjF (DUF2071 family)
MVHHWDCLTFLHWRYDPATVQALLPPGLTVETFDGSAWVGLVPFKLRVGLPHLPMVPWVSHFCETNVRTYVIGPDGSRGVWFFSLDAARLGAVIVARTAWRLPYQWARMRLRRRGTTISYASTRRWPGRGRPACAVTVRVGARFEPEELGELDHYLTARWGLFSTPRHGLSYARALHEPWPLHRGELLHLDDQLVAAAGLPPPAGEPVIHWSERVTVRIGWPHRVG